PFSIGGGKGLLPQSARLQTSNVVGNAQPGFGLAGPNQQWDEPRVFAQPRNAWGDSGRNQFPGPGNWKMGAALLPRTPAGHYRAEIRIESQNIMNHPQWGTPITGFTDPNFMRIRDFVPNRAPRTVQIGARLAF